MLIWRFYSFFPSKYIFGCSFSRLFCFHACFGCLRVRTTTSVLNLYHRHQQQQHHHHQQHYRFIVDVSTSITFAKIKSFACIFKFSCFFVQFSTIFFYSKLYKCQQQLTNCEFMFRWKKIWKKQAKMMK